MVRRMDSAQLAIILMISPREASYIALLASARNNEFITTSLDNWQRTSSPSQRDFGLAYEITSGTMRMALALDYLAKKLATGEKLSLKLKERILIRTAIYQRYFMSKIPIYAIVNDTIEIAKKYCHKTFVAYLNVLLRRLESTNPTLPSGTSIQALSIHYSYPESFITSLISDYGLDEAIEILKAGNLPPVTMAKVLSTKNLEMIRLEDPAHIKEIALSQDFYIQNITPATLINELANRISTPGIVLDLCSSPGGKLISIHDIFPNASLFANDISADKIDRLNQNLTKYNIKAHLTCGNGECYPPIESFDLIILDVPCSNSGVLNKRHEARWRLTKESLDELKITQAKLFKHAASLIKPGAYIWYMTCSILKEENEHFLHEICPELNLDILFSKTFLPNSEGWDGGFGAILSTQAPNQSVKLEY